MRELSKVLLSVLLCNLFAGMTIAQETDASASGSVKNIQLGPRPYYLVAQLPPGALKNQLQQCANGPFYATEFSIGHRGAPLQFPEHTKESYLAAAQMGAGVLECDVTFTKDKELVCRHDQCDLHQTTNILATPLANKCRVPFKGATDNKDAVVECCTSDITLTEFKTLHGKMDGFNAKGRTPKEYMNGTASWRTDLYAEVGTLMTHAESIELFQSLGRQMVPELKAPKVPMPFDGFSQQDYAQKMLDEYVQAGVHPDNVHPQSFNLEDIRYWVHQVPEFGKQGVYLDDRSWAGVKSSDAVKMANITVHQPEKLQPTMQQLFDEGVRVIAPPLWALVTEQDGQIVPSNYARAARKAGLKIVAWTLERSGPLHNGGGWYFQSINGTLGTANIVQSDAIVLELLDVLAKDIGVTAVFSDWPATTSYYASCMNFPPLSWSSAQNE